MSTTNPGLLLIHLPYGDKDPARLEAQVRNAFISFQDITCQIHKSNTSLDAIIVDRTPEHIAIEIQACCDSCAERGHKALVQTAAAN